MQRVKIFIDPTIRSKFGPEVCWIWRLILSTIGHEWEEVSSQNVEVDIAYTSDPQAGGRAALTIPADLSLWDKRSTVTIQSIARSNGFLHPVYKNKGYRDLVGPRCAKGLTSLRDIVFDIFWLVTGQEEVKWPKNKHGFLDLSGTVFFKEQIPRLGLASEAIAWVERNLSKFTEFKPLPRWPNNRRAAVCCTHDVDYPEIRRFLEPMRIVGRRGFSGLRPAVEVIRKKRIHWHFWSWIESEKELGIRSAFYFSAAKGSLLRYLLGIPNPFYDVKSMRFRELFQHLTEEGFEIGLHATYSAFKNKNEFVAERQTLRQSTGQEIEGNRHHYWRLNPDDIESTLKMHEEVGLKYDSSLTHERYIGWRRSISTPFCPFHQAERRELTTLQIPTTWMDDQLFGYSKDNPGDGREILRRLIQRTKEYGGCMVVDMHDYVFDDLLFPGWRKMYLWFLRELVSGSNFWIATPKEVADHWLRRYSSLLDRSSGLRDGFDTVSNGRQVS